MTTRAELIELQQILTGNFNASPARGEDAQRFTVGAVWHGDWFDAAIGGKGHFGSETKPHHFAAISRRIKKNHVFRFAPATSCQKQGQKGVIELPRGAIVGGAKFTNTFLITRLFLLRTRQTLETHYEYTCQLPTHIVRHIKTMMGAAQ